MRKLFLTGLIFIAMIQISNAQSYFHLVDEAYSDYQKKDYENALKVYEHALEISYNNPYDIYNAACCAALSGQREEAIRLLKEAMVHGSTDIKHIQEDSDLTSLRALKDWDKIYSELLSIHAKVENGYNKPLREELLKVLRDDQDIRVIYSNYVRANGLRTAKADSLAKIILNNDSINQIKVVAILNEYGWVGYKEVGIDASPALFAVIQHSNIDIQKKFFPLLKKAVEEGDANPRYLPLMQDRILVREGKKQIYGTQIGTNDVTGKYYLFPLEDPANVDKRREDVGLGHLSDYLKHWGISQDSQ